MKIVNHIRVNGEYVLQESLPEETQKKIGKELGIRFAKSFGYEPIDKKEERVACNS